MKKLISSILLLAALNLLAKDKKPTDLGYLYLDWVWLTITCCGDIPDKLVYPEDNSISFTEAEKIFKRQLDVKYTDRVRSILKRPEYVNLKVDNPASWRGRYLSWLMPKEKWKMLSNDVPLRKRFLWGDYGFPMIWDKESTNGIRNVMMYGGKKGKVVKIEDKEFEELIHFAKLWLTPDKKTSEYYLKRLKEGDIHEMAFAIRMLARKKDVSVLPFVRKYIKYRWFQDACYLALEEMGEESDIPTLIKLTKQPQTNIWGIVIAMCKIGGPEVDKQLAIWLNNNQKRNKYSWQNGLPLGIIDAQYKPAIKILQPLLKDPKTKWDAKSILWDLGVFPQEPGTVSKETKAEDGFWVRTILNKGPYKLNKPINVKMLFINNTKGTVYFTRKYNPKVVLKSTGKDLPFTKLGHREIRSPNDYKRGNFGMPYYSVRANKGRGRNYIEISPVNLTMTFDFKAPGEYLFSCNVEYWFKHDEKRYLKVENLPFTIKYTK